MRFISINPASPTVGVVTADGIRVYAGSEYKEPIHSEILQLKLKKGDKVKLLGQKKGDYHKIAPPTGAYLWVSTKYIKPLGTGAAIVKPGIVGPPKIDTNTGIETIIKTSLPVEGEKLIEYYALQKQIKAEREKPLDQQNYDDISKALKAIADNKAAGKAARYAEFSIKQIQRFELALKVAKAVQLQNEELKNTKDKIQKARDTRLAQHANLGRFAIMGQFQTSNVFSSEARLKLYRVTKTDGDTEKTVCYALPVGQAANMDLSKFKDRKVGLVGTITPHPETARVLVKFTNIIELNKNN
jgi:hypothetical protein